MVEKKYFFLLVILINALIGQSQTNKQPEFQLTSEKFDSAFNYLFIESLNYPNNEIKIDSTGRVKLKSANNFLISSGDYVGQVPYDKFSKIKQYLYEFLNEDNNKKNQNPQHIQDFRIIIKSNKETYDFVFSIKSMFYEGISQMLFSNKSLIDSKLTPFFWYNKRDSLDSSFAFGLRRISFPIIMGESYLLFNGQIQYVNTIILNQKPIKYDYIQVDSITGKSKKIQITTSNKKEVYLYKVKVDSIYSGNSQYCTYEGADLKGKYVYCLSDKLLQLNLKRPYGVIGMHKNFETIDLVSKEKNRLSYVEIVDVFNPDINFSFNYFNRHCSEFYTKWQTYKSRGPEIKKAFSKNQKIIQNAILKDIKKDSIYCDIEHNYSFIENSKASFLNRLSIKDLLKKIQLAYLKTRIKFNAWRTYDNGQPGENFLLKKDLAYAIMIGNQMKIIVISAYKYSQFDAAFYSKNNNFLLKIEDNLNDEYSENRNKLFKTKERFYYISEFEVYLSYEDLTKLKKAKLKKTSFWAGDIDKFQNSQQLKWQLKRAYKRHKTRLKKYDKSRNKK